MTATRLLVLGLVRSLGRAHGYRVSQELMAWDADKWANTKTGSIYHALRQLTKEGCLTAIPDDGDADMDGARTDYIITAEGEEAFAVMMERALSEPQSRSDTLCAGLAFMGELPRAKVLALLGRRLAALSDAQEQAEALPRELATLPDHADALVSFQAETSRAQISWLSRVIGKIDSGAYRFVGEDSVERQRVPDLVG